MQKLWAVLLLVVLLSSATPASWALSASSPAPRTAPACVATLSYGASIGDITKSTSADVPIFVGRFSILGNDLAVSPGALCCANTCYAPIHMPNTLSGTERPV